MAEIINHTYRLKRGTAARWAELNPVLEQGEPGYVYDQNKLKIGDGFTPWNALPYIEGKSEIVNAASRDGFPRIGDATVIYKAADEKRLYQWNPEYRDYEPLMLGGGGEGGSDWNEITIINGGNA